MYDDLLICANNIAEKYRTGEKYNLFKVLEVTGKEVYMCRFLTDLLNPRGKHGRGPYYLKSFLISVLGREDAEEICNSASVDKEYLIEGGRRIDIVIRSRDVFIPIEVKIYADDQRAQCFDYFAYAKKSPVVYLTLWGKEPSAYSRKNEDGSEELKKDDFLCISFAEHILKWLKILIETEDDDVMRIALEQYKESVMELTSVMDIDMQKELVDKVTESEENFRGMLALSRIAGKAKEKLIFDLMNDMEEGMERIREQFKLEKESACHWFGYSEQVRGYFEKNRWPGINYVFRDVLLLGKIQLWLRIEVEPESSIFFGLCLFDPSGNNGNGEQVDKFSQEIIDELRKYVDLDASDRDIEDWWVKWWYLPTGADRPEELCDKVPQFKPAMNDAAISLIDKDKREAFVKESVEVIKNTLDKYMK